MLKKLFIFIFSAIILCGCSNVQEKNVITFSSWGSVTEVEILKQVISNYEKENPDIKINFIHVPQNYFQKIHLLFASKTPPDVLFINNLYLPIYESQLEDLSEIIDKSEYFEQAIDGLSINKKILAYPRDISNQVFYVNLDKTTLPKKNWTLEDLLEISKKTTTNNNFGVSYEPDIYWAKPYLAYFGEDFLSAENYSELKGLIFYKNLRDKYNVAPKSFQVGSQTLAQMFIDGKIALYLSGRWMYPKISEKADFNWAIINFPIGKNPLPCDVSGWAISKSSKNKKEAINFVKYLVSEKNSKYFASTGLIVPARKDSAQILNNNKHNEKVFLEIIKYSSPTNINKSYKQLSDKINRTL